MIRVAEQHHLFEEEAQGLHDKFRGLLRMIPNKETNYATHNIHDYPAKFLPHFPRLFIEEFTKPGETILDPMVGSGTTLVECALLGRRGIGIDIDPIANLIARVSVTPIRESLLHRKNSTLLRRIRSAISARKAESYPIPSDQDYPNVLLWFRPEVIRELLLIRDLVLKERHQPYRNLALVCLSSIVREVSNADPRDIFPERDLRQAVRPRRDVVALFQGALEKIGHRKVIPFSKHVRYRQTCTVIQGDARAIELPSASVDFVITSPPYAYAIDYARVHQLSTLLFVMNNEEFRKLRSQYIGTDRVSSRNHLPAFKGFEFAREEIERIYSEDRKCALVDLAPIFGPVIM